MAIQIRPLELNKKASEAFLRESHRISKGPSKKELSEEYDRISQFIIVSNNLSESRSNRNSKILLCK